MADSYSVEAILSAVDKNFGNIREHVISCQQCSRFNQQWACLVG